jgi:hypothetical protein
MQHGFPFVMVTLPGLVLVQRIDVGIALILDNTTARRYGLSRPYDIRSSFISIPIGEEEVEASLTQPNQRN